MTNKLIERLINKDYLTERERKEWLGTIKERLEALEKENKEYFEIITKQAYLLNNKHIDRPFIEILQQENEKLKKAFQILTQRIVIKAHRNFLFGGRYLDVANTTMKLTDEEYELLKEVLGE